MKYYSKNFIYKIIKQDLINKKHNKIITRFAPEPNGYLHIGHAKSICLNFGIANTYKGKCNLRFDDTNPDNENKEYVKSIKNDIKWLGFDINKNNIFYTSDYFDKLYNYAIKLIKKNLAYVDNLKSDEIVKYRGTLKKSGTNSPYRNRSIEENIYLFEKMKKGFFNEGEACLRAKIDMSSDIIVMRDPILYRIKLAPHHRTKNKWKIYPTYDFAHCLSDAIECITHSLCTLEFVDNRKLYNWILKNLNFISKPKQYEYSRLNIEYNILSKRKLNILVKKKFVLGWDDPRMLTISGLRNRGYTSSSIIDFCSRIGITKQDNIVEHSLLEFCISDDLNKNAIRTMGIINPVKIIIENLPIGYEEIIHIPNHPYNKSMGYRKVIFSREIYIDRLDFCEYENNENTKLLKINHEIRLRYSYIIKAIKIEKDKNNNISCIKCIYDDKTLGKKPINRIIKGVIHWVSVVSSLPAKFKIYENLFNIKNPNNKKNFLDYINKNSLIIKKGFIDKSINFAKAYQLFQFEREGYFILEKINKNKEFVFNRTMKLKNKKY